MQEQEDIGSTVALEPWGRDLHRPECVVATRAGDVYVPDWRGGITLIQRDGQQRTWWPREPRIDLRPNALCILPDGAFLVANLGDDGGVWKLTRDGSLSPYLTEIEGIPVPPANFVTTDSTGRVWTSISTRHVPRQGAWRNDVADGLILVVDRHGGRIAAEGLHYTNEIRIDPTGRWLYAVETFGRRIVRFPIGPGAVLGAGETVAGFGHGTFPDGFAFDEEDALWVTSLISNRLIRVRSDGKIDLVFEDANPERVDEVERAFAGGEMRAEHLGPIDGTRIQQLTSISFGGPDRRTAFLGSLHASCVYRFRSPVAGAETESWRLG